MHEGSLFSTSSPIHVIYCIFDNNHSDRGEVISRCGYALHFPDDLMLNIFHVCVGDLYVFFGKMSIQILCPLLTGLFALLMLSCMNSLLFWILSPYQKFL